MHLCQIISKREVLDFRIPMNHASSTLLNRLLARGKFRHIQVLLQLAELGSVQRTADAIGMTQSWVTQMLAYLEELVGTPLFERHARGVRPTTACRDILPMARQLMMGLSDSADAIIARRMQGEGVVRLIGSAAATNGLLVDALPRFVDEHPSVHVQLREAEDEDQLLAITRGEVDLVACRRPPVIPESWEFHPAREDRLAIVCRTEHPLARTRKPRLEELARHIWLVLPAGIAGRGRFDDLWKDFAQPPQTYPVVTRSQSMVWWLLRNRDLIALLPRTLATPLINSGLVVDLAPGDTLALPPIGVLQPHGGMGEAALKLSQFLLSSHVAPSAPTGRRKKGVR